VSKLLPGADMPARRRRPTPPYVLIGSPHYAAPEQLCAQPAVDTRADIWALGAILYRLVTGQPPRTGRTLLELYASVLREAPRPCSLLRPDVSVEFGSVVARALANDPNARYQTVADLARALAPFVQRRALASVERIEGLYRSRPKPASSGGVRATPAVFDGTGERTPSTQPEPFAVTRARRGRRL
jgi:serine/threonine protein kinase